MSLRCSVELHKHVYWWVSIGFSSNWYVNKSRHLLPISLELESFGDWAVKFVKGTNVGMRECQYQTVDELLAYWTFSGLVLVSVHVEIKVLHWLINDISVDYQLLIIFKETTIDRSSIKSAKLINLFIKFYRMINAFHLSLLYIFNF